MKTAAARGRGGSVAQRALLLGLLDEGYNRPAWHGPNLRGSLARLTAREAARRPAPGRHNIWEIAVHAAYWKYAVRRRLKGERRGSFPLKGSNWFPRTGEGGEEAWRRDLELLEDMHLALRQAVEGLVDTDLARVIPPGRHTVARIVAGAALHDVYHAGQVRTLKRLML
jgi:uncharacterized damage-inducible protein DinB